MKIRIKVTGVLEAEFEQEAQSAGGQTVVEYYLPFFKGCIAEVVKQAKDLTQQDWVNYDGVEWRWTGKVIPHMFRKGLTAKQFVPVVAQKMRKRAQLHLGVEQPDFGTIGWW